MANVRDPYRDEDIEQRISDLRKKVKHHRDETTFFLINSVLLLAGAIVCVLGWAVLDTFGKSSTLLYIGTGAAYGLLNCLMVTCLAKEAMERRTLDRLSALPLRIEVATSPSHHMSRLATALRDLDSVRRAEFRPLWDAALEANVLLTEAGPNPAALDRIRKRADAAEAVRKADHDLSEAARKDQAEMKRAATLSAYASDDDSDLELASIYVQAIEAGTLRYRELNASSTSE